MSDFWTGFLTAVGFFGILAFVAWYTFQRILEELAEDIEEDILKLREGSKK